MLWLAPFAGRAQDVFPREQVQATFATALGAILELHLDHPTPAQLGLWLMRGLEVLEPGLHTELQSGTLLLHGGRRLLAARAVPGPGPVSHPQQAAPALASALAALYAEAWQHGPALREAGVEKMLSAGFEEMFPHLDPYSRYLTPAEAEIARFRRGGQGGLGLRLAAGRGGQEVRIASLGEAGAAARGGLRAGDRLLAVDGTPVAADDLPAATALLEGPSGTSVTLLLERGRRRFQAVLERGASPPPLLEVERRGDLLWLRLGGFNSRSESEVTAALEDAFRTAPPRGVVLDLRGNRGGVLSQAVGVASLFLADGVIARTDGRHPDAARTWVSAGPDLAQGVPVVVLIDGRTASSAEILAAALADRARAVAVGSTTTGKGLIQAVIALPNGGELFLSWSRVLAPRGWPIQGLGVLPAICTSLGAETLAQELAELRRGEPPLAEALAEQRALRVPVPAREIARLRDRCPPAEGREADATIARALIEAPEEFQAALPR